MVEKRKIVVQNNYTKVYEPLLMASTILNSETGEECFVSLHDKLVYSYILKQSIWFKSKGKVLFQSQDSVAEILGFDRKTVNKSIKKLEEIGLVLKSKKRMDSCWKMCYFAENLFSGKFKLFAEIEIRLPHEKTVKETVEIVQTENKKHLEYMTASEFQRLSKKAEYDYENDDTVIPY